MVETPGAFSQPPAAPQKTNPWLIVLVSCVVLCCFYLGATGLLFAFGGPILNELGLLQALIIQP